MSSKFFVEYRRALDDGDDESREWTSPMAQAKGVCVASWILSIMWES
jgi:hypothetical protein